MDQLKVRYFQTDEAERREHHVSAAFDILFEHVLRGDPPPQVERDAAA